MKIHCLQCGAIHERKSSYCSVRCSGAAHRAKKKGEEPSVNPVVPDPDAIVQKFTAAFGFPVRLYWSRRLEATNSSCAKAGTVLDFEQITRVGGTVVYRVRRGKRNFFTSSKEIDQI